MSNNDEKQKLENEQTGEIVGGRNALLPKMSIFKDRCDLCDKVINWSNSTGIKVKLENGKDGVLCAECWDKQKNALGKDNAVAQWLGIKTQTESNYNKPNSNKIK